MVIINLDISDIYPNTVLKMVPFFQVGLEGQGPK
jgi:hypothetical protein